MQKYKVLHAQPLALYKTLIFSLAVGLFALYVVQFNFGTHTILDIIFYTYVTSYFLYKGLGIRRTYQMKRIVWDGQYFNLHYKGYELQIPKEEVVDLRCIHVLGIYQATLKKPYDFGKRFYFKPSWWYPINFRRVDKRMASLID